MSKLNDEKTVDEAVKESDEKETQPEESQKEKVQEEKTIADATKTPDDEEKKDSVPLAKYMDERKKRQELESRIKEMEESPKESVTSSSLQEMADDLGVDIEVAKKIASSVKSDIMSEISPRFEEMDAEKKAKAQRKVLNDLFKTAIDKNPDYKQVVDKETIINLAKLPENKGKTMSQIIEQTYSKVPEGESKKSMETNKGSDKSPKKVDFAKLSKMSDEEQLEVLNDPENRQAYNKYLEDNLNL